MAKEKAKSKKAAAKPAKEDAKRAEVEQTPATADMTPSATKVHLGSPEVQAAIKEGLALIKDGKSKADAAWAIYGKIKDEGKDLIVAAFMIGATLTAKGALTYWYNCRRRASKEAKKTA